METEDFWIIIILSESFKMFSLCLPAIQQLIVQPIVAPSPCQKQHHRHDKFSIFLEELQRLHWEEKVNNTRKPRLEGR